MPGVSVKTDSVETAQVLIDAGVGVRAPYFHRSWVNLPWGTAEDELRHRLAASYKLVRTSLPKKVQAQLGPFERAGSRRSQESGTIGVLSQCARYCTCARVLRDAKLAA
jgi:hypothetical protein